MGLPMPRSQNVGSSNQSIPARASFSMNRAFGGLMTNRGHSSASASGTVPNCAGGNMRAVTPSSVPGSEMGTLKQGVVFQPNGPGPKGSPLLGNGGMGRGFSSSKSKEVVGGGAVATATSDRNCRSLPATVNNTALTSMQASVVPEKATLAARATTNRPSVVSTATANAASSTALASRSFPGHAASVPLPVAASVATQAQEDTDPDPRVLDYKTPEAAVGVPNTPYANFSRSSNLSISSGCSSQQHTTGSGGTSSNAAPQLAHSSSSAVTEPPTSQEMVASTVSGSVRAPSAVRGLAGTARPRICVGCGSAATVRCSVCKAGYCSSDCQHEDWHYHRKECHPPPPLEEYSFVPHNDMVKVKQEPLSPPPSSAQLGAQQHRRQEQAMPEQEAQALQLDGGRAASPLPTSVHHASVAEKRRQQEACLLEQRQQLNGGRPALGQEKPQQLKLIPRSVALSRSTTDTKPVAAAAAQPMPGDSKMKHNDQVGAVKKTDMSLVMQKETPSAAALKKAYPVGSVVSILQLGSIYSAMVTTINDISSFTLLVFVDGTEDILQVGSVQLEECPIVTGFSPKVGQLIASQSLHDASWCRSYVFGINDSGYQVCHIDFGYIETVLSVKPMPEGMCLAASGTGLCAVLDQGANSDAQELALLVKDALPVHFRVTATGEDAVTAVLLGEDGRDIGTYLLQSWYEGIASLLAVEQARVEEVKPDVASNSAVEKPKMETLISPSKVVEMEHAPTAAVKPAQSHLRDDSSRSQQPQPPVVSSARDDPFGPDEVPCQPGLGNTKSRCGVSSSGGGRRGGCFMLDNLKQLSLDLGERYTVMPVWCEEDFLFVQLHTEELVEMFRKLMTNIVDHCTLSASPDAVQVGELVCGYIQADSLWYRALVMQVEPTSSAPAFVTLYFVDFGSTERVSVKHVRPFIRPFLDVPVMCVKVALCGDAPKKGAPLEQLTNVYEILKELVEVSGQLMMIVVARNDQSAGAGAPTSLTQIESLLVRLFDKDGLLCINDTVICMGGEESASAAQPQQKQEEPRVAAGEAPDDASGPTAATLPSDAAAAQVALKPKETMTKADMEPAHLMYEDCESLKMEPGENVDLVVLTATNTHTIMVIPQKDIGLMEQLETLSAKMNDYCNALKKVYYEPDDGEVVLAKFSQDGLWYRAACLTTVRAEGAAMVQFVDYGNVETVLYDCLVQMLVAFVKPLPFLALHTVLEGSGAQPSSKERCSARLAELLPPFSCVTAARVSAQDPDTLTHAIALPHVLNTLREEQLLE